MAIQDFHKYLKTIQKQVTDMKSDLADFNKAFEDGYITEDKLAEIKEEFNSIDINYQRLLYIDYLLAIPNKKTKKNKFKKATGKINDYFEDRLATADKVMDENKNIWSELYKKIKDLTK